jgi:hypothetical protein
MPHNLDETTQKIILTVSTFTTTVIAIPALIGQFRLVPNLRRRLMLSAQSDDKTRPSLLVGCLGFLILMFFATVIFTSPIVLYLEHEQDDITAAAAAAAVEQQSSSINFCEEDFRHTPYIAEPANVISSLTSYVPLALLGLFGPPSTQYKREKRFIAVYATLLAIGLGSSALHGLLTAEAQGGDELPMLWYTASTAFCSIDVILVAKWKQQEQRTTVLALLVILSAVVATITYVARREDFTIFYIIFSLYSQTMVVSVVWICFGINWEETKQMSDAGIHFKATVLFPLAIAAGWTTILNTCHLGLG